MSNNDQEQSQEGQANQIQIVARFEACPWCGSTRRMMGELGEEMKKQGLIAESMDVGLNEIGGSVIDPTKAGQMLSRSIRMGAFALRDVCIGCGRDITVKIERKPVMVDLRMPTVPGQPGQLGQHGGIR